VELQLRPAGREDTALFRALFAATRADELALLPWDEPAKEAFVDQQLAAQAHHHAGAEVRVITVDGEPAGRLVLDRSGDAVHVVDIALLPAYRGRGAGGQVLRWVQGEARAARRPVSLHVERGNPARRLYARLGFAVTGEGPVHDRMAWQPPGSGEGGLVVDPVGDPRDRHEEQPQLAELGVAEQLDPLRQEGFGRAAEEQGERRAAVGHGRAVRHLDQLEGQAVSREREPLAHAVPEGR
jgi:ribosomal protein S18 acetylase RimI-like enzyme